MQELRQGTGITVKIGQFLSTDGITPQTTIVPVIELAKADPGVSTSTNAFAARGSSIAVSHDADGYFNVHYSSGDVDTLGKLDMKAVSTGEHLSIQEDYMVLLPEFWDAKYSTDDRLNVNVREVSDSTAAADDLEAKVGNLDAAISGRQPSGAVDLTAGAVDAVWQESTRVLTAGTNIVLAKGVGVTGFTDISTANVDAALTAYGALKPTVAGRTLDVTLAGLAGLDLDNTAGTLGTADFDAGFLTAGLIAANAIDESALSTGAAAAISDEVWANSTRVLTGGFPTQIQKNQALGTFSFPVVSTDHVTPKTALTVLKGTRSIDGGAFAALTNSTNISEVANGFYKVNGGLSAADLNGGQIDLRFATTEVGADDTLLSIITQPSS